MSYAALYSFCQTLPTPIRRTALKAKIKELCGVNAVKVIRTNLDTNVLLGYFVSPGDCVAGGLPNITAKVPTIVVARGLDYVGERFVVIKELMHLFDTDLEKVGTAEDLEALLTGLISPQPTRSISVGSEVRAYWQAIGVMCPEARRQEFQRQRGARKITDAEIAAALGMPEFHVTSLFEGNYKEIISNLLG